MDNKQLTDILIGQIEDADESQAWLDAMYAAFLRRTKIPAENAVVYIHKDEETGDTFCHYEALVGFEDDGTPVTKAVLPLPWMLWELAYRFTEARPVLSASVGVFISLLTVILWAFRFLQKKNG